VKHFAICHPKVCGVIEVTQSRRWHFSRSHLSVWLSDSTDLGCDLFGNRKPINTSPVTHRDFLYKIPKWVPYNASRKTEYSQGEWYCIPGNPQMQSGSQTCEVFNMQKINRIMYSQKGCLLHWISVYLWPGPKMLTIWDTLMGPLQAKSI